MATIKGGGKLEQALREIAEKVKHPAKLRVGFLAGATYPDGTPVAMVAAIQDYGAPSRSIPPRPFFRNMVASKSKQWPADVAAAVKSSDYDAEAALALVGEHIRGQLQQAINDFNGAPLAAAT